MYFIKPEKFNRVFSGYVKWKEKMSKTYASVQRMTFSKYVVEEGYYINQLFGTDRVLYRPPQTF